LAVDGIGVFPSAAAKNLAARAAEIAEIETGEKYPRRRIIASKTPD
jgi:hypothetical protein